MPVPSFASHKVANGELSSATKFNNLVQAIEDEFGDIDADQIPGYPSSAAKYLRGDGVWAGDWTAYTPTWTTAGTAPALGNGTLTGRYLQIGKLLTVTIQLVAGSTTTFGTGQWSFSLPVNQSLAVKAAQGATYFDSSAVALYPGLARAGATVTTIDMWNTVSPMTALTATAPFVWATSDQVDLLYIVEAA